jgi:hypothetical protein
MTDLALPQGDDGVRALDADTDAVDTADEPAIESAANAEHAPDDDDDPSTDDGEEIEHDGRTYRVPKALKDAFLRQADYTRKTQELAEQRRGFEQEAARRQAAQQADLEGYARLVALNDQVKAFEQLDWTALERQDPAQAQSLWRQYSQLKDGRSAMIGQLLQREDQRAFETQRDAARRIEEGRAVLAREIQGWSPELASKLSDFGQREFGFTAQEIGGVVDPRMVKVLHLAFVGRQSQQKQAAARKAEASHAALPIRQVGSQATARRPSTTEAASDRMSTADWFRAEQERVRRKAGR